MALMCTKNLEDKTCGSLMVKPGTAEFRSIDFTIQTYSDLTPNCESILLTDLDCSFSKESLSDDSPEQPLM